MVTANTQTDTPLVEKVEKCRQSLVKFQSIIGELGKTKGENYTYYFPKKGGLEEGRSVSNWRIYIKENLQKIEKWYERQNSNNGGNGNGNGGGNLKKEDVKLTPVNPQSLSGKQLFDFLRGGSNKPVDTPVIVEEAREYIPPVEIKNLQEELIAEPVPKRAIKPIVAEEIKEYIQPVEIEKPIIAEPVLKTALQKIQGNEQEEIESSQKNSSILQPRRLDSLLVKVGGEVEINGRLFKKRKASLKGYLWYLDGSLDKISDAILNASRIFGREYVDSRTVEPYSEISLDKKYKIPKSFQIEGEKVDSKLNANVLNNLRNYLELISVELLSDIDRGQVAPSHLETAVQVLEDTKNIFTTLQEKSKANKKFNEKEMARYEVMPALQSSLDYFGKSLSLKSIEYLAAFKKIKRNGAEFNDKNITKVCSWFGLFPDIKFIKERILPKLAEEGNIYQEHVQVLRKPLATSVSRLRNQEEAENYLKLKGSIGNISEYLKDLLNKSVLAIRGIPSVMINFTKSNLSDEIAKRLQFKYLESPTKRVQYPLQNFFIEARDLSARVNSMDERIHFKDLNHESPFYRALVKETLEFKEDFKEMVKKCSGLWSYGLWYGSQRMKGKAIDELMTDVMRNGSSIERTFYSFDR